MNRGQLRKVLANHCLLPFELHVKQ